MAVTFQLTDGTTTHNLNDLSATFLQGVNLGNPGANEVYAGSLFAPRQQLVAHSFTRRAITAQIRCEGATIQAVSQFIVDVNSAIRLGRDYTTSGVNNRWRLKWNPGGSAKDIYFVIQNGSFAVPSSAVQPAILGASLWVAICNLTLTCDPLGEGDAETIENFVPNPSFEFAGTALADWTESKTASGSTARSTTTAKYGDASLKLIMTSGTSSQVIERNVTLADVDAAEVWSFQAWVRIDALSNCKVVFEVDYTTGTDITSESTTVDATQFVALTLNNKTVPGSVTAATLRCRLEATGGSATGTVYFDGITAVQATAVPTTWVSGHTITNHFDDDGQSHVNYIDLYDIPGDQFAKLKVTALEGEAHTKFWAGARHGSRMTNASLFHEGEDFSGFTSGADASSSGGAYGYVGVGGAAFVAAHSHTGSSVTGAFTDSVSTTAGNLLFVATAAYDAGSGRNISSCTYNGETGMTLTGDTVGGNSIYGTNARFQHFFFDLDDAKFGGTGAHDLVANVQSAQTADYILMIALEFSGLAPSYRETWSYQIARNTGAPYWYEGYFWGNGTSSTTTHVLTDTVVNSQAGDMVLMMSAGVGGSHSGHAANWTEHIDVTTTYLSLNAASFIATGGSTVVSHTGPSGSYAIWGGALFADAAPSAAAPAVGTLDIASPPLGTYLILERWANPDGANWGTRLSHTYGGVTNDPTVAAHYNDLPTSQTAFHVKEGGNLVVPPSRLPDGSTIGTLQLRMCSYQKSGDTTDTLRLDWVMLLPVDEGFAYATKATGTDAVVIDTIGEPSQIALETSAGVFQSRPESMGRGIYGSPDGTRIYMISDDAVDATIADGWTVTVKVVPQYLMVGGE